MAALRRETNSDGLTAPRIAAKAETLEAGPRIRVG